MSAARESAPLAVGTLLELTVGPVAHGGHCVARIDDDLHGRVVFIRHALPGERVRARITEDTGGSFCRADAVDVLVPDSQRVPLPCPHAGPGRCGGCDFQHVAPARQRQLKGEVVREQFARLAKLDVAVEVEELDGGPLGWRTRTVYAVSAQGQVGLHRHRSHEVETLSRCPLGASGVGDNEALQEPWPGISGLEAVQDGRGGATLLTHSPARSGGRGPEKPPERGRQARGSDRGRVRGNGLRERHHRRLPDVVTVHRGADVVTRQVLDREFDVAAAGFWQVHPHAAETFARALLAALEPAPGEVVLDLYAGAGLFSALFGDRVGQTGRIIGIESDTRAVADADTNLAGIGWATMHQAKVSPTLVQELGTGADLVILDPPRSGAGRDILRAVLDLAPRKIGYLACDPASLARDVATAIDAGWRVADLRAFDAFPMTHHIECLAVLVPGP